MDNPVTDRLRMFERLNKLEARIKYMVLEAPLNCDCIKCLRLKDQFDKFIMELEEAYPVVKSEGAPPRPPMPPLRRDVLKHERELPEFKN